MNIENSTTEEQCYPGKAGIAEKVSELRWKLGNKAKQEPNFRFYALYDRIYRKDVLTSAYRRIRMNNGAAGIDGIRFEDIEKEKDGVENLINQIFKELKEKTYRPGAVKRVYIPKPDDKLRPLGIPNIRDRLVQMAILIIIEPIFEVDFEDCSWGFRPQRSAHGALREINDNLKMGRKEVYDSDLSSYFDTIDHELLMKMVERRIADRQVLKLIRMFLESSIVDQDKDGGIKRHKPTKGTPQGGVISPLLSNIFLHAFDEAFMKDASSPLYFANARLVRYADDFVVMAKYCGKRIIEWIQEKIERELKLIINKDKTRVVKVGQESEILSFLGYSFRYDRDLRGRKRQYLNFFPADKSVHKMKEKIKECTSRPVTAILEEVIQDVNRSLHGWANYFSIGYPRKAYRELNYYSQTRLLRFCQNRSQRKYNSKRSGESWYAYFERKGLVYL